MANLGVFPPGQSSITPPQHISWLTAEQYLNYPTGTGLSTSDPLYSSGTLQSICNAACAWIENYCGTYFVQQTGVDERYMNINIQQQQNIILPVRAKPINNINTIYLQVLKYFIPIAFDYLTVFENQGYMTFFPLLTTNVGASPLPVQVLNSGTATVWVNYDFGVAATNIDPALLETAVHMTTRFIAAQENPTGAESIKMGDMAMSWKRMKGTNDPMSDLIEEALKPFKSYYFLTV